MDPVREKLVLRPNHWEEMLADVSKRTMEEACGLVGGKDHTSTVVYPVANILHSPSRYRMDPEEQLKAFNHLDENQWELLAIYHSHLNGPTGPSHIDIIEAMYPGVVYLIWFRQNYRWDCRGFLIEEMKVEQVPIFISSQDQLDNQTS